MAFLFFSGKLLKSYWIKTYFIIHNFMKILPVKIAEWKEWNNTTSNSKNIKEL